MQFEMVVRQLYELQELDAEIAQQRGRIAAIDGQLSDRTELEARNRELEDQSALHHELDMQQRAQDLDTDSVRTKLLNIEAKLYSGSITNLRELEGFEKEASILRDQLQKLDGVLLDKMMAVEDGRSRLQSLQEELSQAEERSKIKNTELKKERKGLLDNLVSLEARRSQLTVRVGQRELELYEGLRSSKGGMAVAKVERGLCRGCRMALPTHQLQLARAGRTPVHCNSCGRILFVD